MPIPLLKEVITHLQTGPLIEGLEVFIVIPSDTVHYTADFVYTLSCFVLNRQSIAAF